MDGIERQLGDQAQVLRISVTHEVGRALAVRYRVSGVPTFVLLDGRGQVVLRQAGPPQREAIVQAVAQLKE